MTGLSGCQKKCLGLRELNAAGFIGKAGADLYDYLFNGDS
jgi:hypothetical protein